MNPLLALPAVLCLVIGGLLGTWGWTQRDESRAAIVEVPETDEHDGPAVSFPIESEVGDPAIYNGDEYLKDTCADLQAAARLEVPAGDPSTTSTPASGSSTTEPGAGTTEAEGTVPGWAIVAALDLDRVQGIPSLDVPDVLRAMDREREAIEDALRAGRDWRTDGVVVSTSFQLAQILQLYCPG